MIERRLGGVNGQPDITGAERLTPREREVLGRIIAGASNKEAGRTLGISPRTVEVHRARIMDKLGAKNAADLVRSCWGRRRRAERRVLHLFASVIPTCIAVFDAHDPARH